MAEGQAVRPSYAPGPVVFSFLFALTVLKGLRMPNRWATTHYLLTYRTGFMKRALWGDVLSRAGGAWTSKYFVLAAIALAVLVTMLGLTVAILRRAPDGPWRVPFLLVFLASPAISFAAHLAGYLEQLAYIGLLIVLWPRRSWTLQVAIAVAAAGVLPLVHEASLFWVGGLSVLVIVAGPLARDRSTRSRLVAAALLSFVWLTSTFAVTKYGLVSPERAAEIRDERTAFADTRPRQDAFQTLAVPLKASLADMRRRWTEPDMRLGMAFSLLVFLPSIVFFGALAVRGAGLAGSSAGMRALTVALVLAAIVGPLLLHLVGWDLHRWNALAAWNAGLAALVVLLGSTAPAGARAALPASAPWLAGVTLGLCLWNVSSDPTLFDGYGAAHPPFQYQIQFLIEAIQGRDPNIWIPRPGN